MGTQDTIIYRLVMRNHSFGPYLSFSIFGPYVGPKMGVAPRPPILVGGLKTQPKVDPLGAPFGYTIISKSCFRFFWGPQPEDDKNRVLQYQMLFLDKKMLFLAEVIELLNSQILVITNNSST